MRTKTRGWILAIALAAMIAAPGLALAEDETDLGQARLQLPGEFVRRVENDKAVIILGYRVANNSVGDDWLLLEVAMTILRGTPTMTLTRDDFKVKTPDGKLVSLATQEEFSEAGRLRALNEQASRTPDSLNYLPGEANVACRIGFFWSESLGTRAGAHDQFSVNPTSACMGRLFFKMPDPIDYGQHQLAVNLEGAVQNVPFLIMTKEELKEKKKEYKQKKKEWKQQQKEAKKAASESN
jgi:hypothetical protein